MYDVERKIWVSLDETKDEEVCVFGIMGEEQEKY